MINWRPRAAAHSDATAMMLFAAKVLAAKSIIAVGILRVPQRARGAFAKRFGKRFVIEPCAQFMPNLCTTSIGFVAGLSPIFSVHKVILRK